MLLRPFLRTTIQVLSHLRHAYGCYPRHCNLCGHHGRFFAFGYPVRLDARCPHCASLERHRQLALADAAQHFFTGKRVLHFAPEPALTRYIQQHTPASYIACDLHHATHRENIEALSFPPASFDTILCSHVLEHVDDAKALREMHRVLAPKGRALILVPIVEGWSHTYENHAIHTPKDRDLHFGQHDHARFYGSDIRQRITAAGFSLTEHTATEPDVHHYGLLRGEKIFIAEKI